MSSEYGLALSYLHIYASLSSNNDDNGEEENVEVQVDHNGTDRVNATTHIVKDSTKETKDTTADNNNHKNNVWEEFEWTVQHENESRCLLEKSMERCSIQAIPSYHQAPNDDFAWDSFYSQHNTNFFKDRHYLHTAFPQEFGPQQQQHSAADAAIDSDTIETTTTTTVTRTKTTPTRTLVEIGCGVGNALLPLLETSCAQEHDQTNSSNSSKNKNSSNEHEPLRHQWIVYGLDLSSVAIGLLKQDERFQAASKLGYAHAFVSNIVQGIPAACHEIADVSSLFFCLSAIDPKDQPVAVQNAASTVRPGGTIVFRDYGRFDESQLKLGSQRGKLLKDNFYVKHDATKCYFFTTTELRDLFETHAGLEVMELEYVRRIYWNRATKTSRKRVWVQGRFRKPLLSTTNQ
ncbi:hypothetical protein ACA910_004934 [Epithemia clementina (nom. ined.)]